MNRLWGCLPENVLIIIMTNMIGIPGGIGTNFAEAIIVPGCARS